MTIYATHNYLTEGAACLSGLVYACTKYLQQRDDTFFVKIDGATSNKKTSAQTSDTNEASAVTTGQRNNIVLVVRTSIVLSRELYYLRVRRIPP